MRRLGLNGFLNQIVLGTFGIIRVLDMGKTLITEFSAEKAIGLVSLCAGYSE